MTYILINLGVIIGVFFFFRMTRSTERTESFSVYTLITIIVFQAFFCILSVLCETLGLKENFFEKCYIFTLYYGLIVLMGYAFNYGRDYLNILARVLTVILTLITVFYCFFIKDSVPLLDNSMRLYRASFDTINDNYVVYFMRSVFSYLILTIITITLFIRMRKAKLPIFRFRLLLVFLTFALLFFIYEFTLFTNTKLLFYYDTSALILFLVVLLLEKITATNHIPSKKTTMKIMLDFFIN